jgi:quercetin dioxygenase-like cupin family protein
MIQPKNISPEIQYQEGSVVSKEIINKPAGTVTLFAFDKGQGLSEHAAPFDALVFITDGIAEITVGGKSHKVKTGEMFLIGANSPHSLKAAESFKMILTMIKSIN